VMSNPVSSYQRPHAAVLASRLREPRRFLQVVAGARKVGKTTPSVSSWWAETASRWKTSSPNPSTTGYENERARRVRLFAPRRPRPPSGALLPAPPGQPPYPAQECLD